MLTFTMLLESTKPPLHRVFLTFHERSRGRLRITTENGLDAGIQIERGQILNNGQLIASVDGDILEVRAKAESVSVATTPNTLLFARACYHVGNRHAEVQISERSLIYLHDHVMDDMLKQLGLDVTTQQLPFQPENGAYSVGAHSHDHAHEHPHTHKHTHHHEH